MMILGLGTDIVEIVRIGQMIERHGEQFIQRIYSAEEIRFCSRRSETYQHYAGRWAAKEAILKVLGTGIRGGIRWRDIEVLALANGQPTVHLKGAARDHAESQGIDEVLITISHCQAYATATAIGIRVM